jgi:hypothetical protein
LWDTVFWDTGTARDRHTHDDDDAIVMALGWIDRQAPLAATDQIIQVRIKSDKEFGNVQQR